MRLGDLTTLDVAAAPPLLAVPIGSCEQHGPHLPLSTDTLIAEALADRLAARRDDVVVAPAIGVSASGEHAGFAGTLSIGTAAATATIVELVRSAGWARGVILVNGHGGNAEAVAEAGRVLRHEGRSVLAWWPPPLPAPHDAHAGHTETSLLLAIAPQLVRLDRIAPGVTTPLAELAPSLRAVGVAAIAPAGVLGDPRAATLEAGTRLLDLFTDHLVAATAAATADDTVADPSPPLEA